MYLPAIESGFKPWAVSRSGASGLWQFMMNSISPYDIDVNEWQDDRRDFWKATEAALSKLQYNYSKLGDWFLAIAAYNCGLGRVQRAVAASGSTDYIELYEQGLIPKETRNYVPKFLAFIHIATHRGRYGFYTEKDEASLSGYWKRIELKQAVDLDMLAKESGVPLSVLEQGNAELRYGITPPAGSGYYLKVPYEFTDNIVNVLENDDEKLLRFYIHVIQSGDTFYALSKHFGIPVSMIQSYNPGANPQTLRSGQNIIIPVINDTGPYRIESGETESWAQTVPYTVISGDTLWSIAMKHDTSAETLAANNGIPADGIIKAGTVIQVPGGNQQ